MSVAAFLAELRRRDIRLRAEGDRLHCDAPSGALTAELREELRRRKADVLEFLRAAQSLAHQERAIVPLQHHGSRPAIFAIPGHNGDVFCYRALAQCLGRDQPFYGLEPPGLDGYSEPLERVEDIAAYFAAQIRAFGAGAPCILAGYCAGSTVALELAHQLRGQGTAVIYLAVFGSPNPTWYRWPAQLRWRLQRLAGRTAMHARALALRPPRQWRGYLRDKWRERHARLAAERTLADDPILVRRSRVERATLQAVRRYEPVPFAGRIGVYLPGDDAMLNHCARRWHALAERVDAHFSPPGSDGFNLLRAPYAAATAASLRRCLDELAAP